MNTDNNQEQALKKTTANSGFLDDIFNLKEEVIEPTNMSKDEFVDKTKKNFKLHSRPIFKRMAIEKIKR